MFPVERAKTYNPGDTIAAAELNQIQDGVIDNYQAISRGRHDSVTLYQPIEGIHRTETGPWTQNLDGTVQTSTDRARIWIPVLGLQVGDVVEELGVWVKDQEQFNCRARAYRWDGATAGRDDLGWKLSAGDGEVQLIAVPVAVTVGAQHRFQLNIENFAADPLILHAVHVKKKRL